jgi:nucleotide-binding universal stress UspA family protein
MFKYILLAADGSDLADKAVRSGLNLANALGAKCTVVIVSEPWTVAVPPQWAVGLPLPEYDEICEKEAQSLFARVDEQANALAISCGHVHVRDKFAAEGILEEAKTLGCDLIVMATHGRRGIRRVLLGSTAMRVLAEATIPVLVCK